MSNVHHLQPNSSVRGAVRACFEAAVRVHVESLDDDQLLSMLKAPLEEHAVAMSVAEAA